MKKKKMKSILAILVALTLVATFTGCQQSSTTKTATGVQTKSGSTTYPLTITDDSGTSITIDKEPQKIVSLSPSDTEIIFAIGEGSKLVGRTDYCDYPEEASAVTSIGSFSSPNLEKIIELAPDIVMSSDFVSDEMSQQLQAIGAQVIVVNPTSIDGVLNNIVMAGEISNANDKAKEVVEGMEKQRQELIAKAATIKEPKSVFIDIGKFYTAGPGSMLDSMLTDLNAKNIAADATSQWAQLSTEAIIADNPDVYISLYTKPDVIKATPGFDQINAIANNNIVYFEYLTPESDMVQRPGPRIIEGMALLAQSIYPNIFSK